MSVTGAVERWLASMRSAMMRRVELAGASDLAANPRTSRSRIRPFRPVPVADFQSMPRLAAARRARGELGGLCRAGAFPADGGVLAATTFGWLWSGDVNGLPPAGIG